MTSTLRLYRSFSNTSGPVALAVGAALLLAPAPAYADGPLQQGPKPAIEPVTVAVVAVTVTAVGLVVSWINANADDVKAATAVKTSGKHKGNTDFKNDSGFSTAGQILSKVDDMNGYGYAIAYAHEGFFGTTISGADYRVNADGFARFLESTPDNHHIEFEARASIDGHVEGKGSQDGKIFAGPGIFDTGDIDVKFGLSIDASQFQLTQPTNLGPGASSSVNWSFSQSVDGIERFYTSASMDHLGNLSFGYHDGVAGIPEEAFSFTNAADQYILRLNPNAFVDGKDYYMLDFFTDTVTPPSALTGNAEGDPPVFTYDLSGAQQTDGQADAAIDGVPEPASWLMLILGFGATGTVMRRGRARQRLIAA